MRPDQVNGKPLNGMPPEMLAEAMEKIKERDHYWVATVMFMMTDQILKGDEIALDLSNIRAQTIRCMICGMPWKKGREGRICQGTGE